MEQYVDHPKKLDAYFVTTRVHSSDLDEFQRRSIPIPQSWVWRIPFDTKMALRIANSLPSIETISALVSKGWKPDAIYAARLLDLYAPSVIRDTIYYMILHHHKQNEEKILREHASHNALCRLNAITTLSKGPFKHEGISNAQHLTHIHPMYVYRVYMDNGVYGINVTDILSTAVYSMINPLVPATFSIGFKTFTLNDTQKKQVIHMVVDLMKKCYPAYYSGYQSVMKGYDRELPMYPEWGIVDFASFYHIDEESIRPRLESNNQFMALTRHIPIIRKMEKDRSKSLDAAVKEYLQE